MNLFVSLILALTAAASSLRADNYQPELYLSAELLYENEFETDGPHHVGTHWVIRQETQWQVVDGILVGSSATKEYQKRMQAIDPTHDGTRPVIFLKPVPSELILRLRLRYTGEVGEWSRAQLDLGHHINSFIFAADRTKLTLDRKEKIFIDGDFLAPNTSAEVTIALKEGKLLIQIYDRKEIIEHEMVTLKTDRPIQQVDFKGLHHGTIEIDWIKVYQGIE